MEEQAEINVYSRRERSEKRRGNATPSC